MNCGTAHGIVPCRAGEKNRELALGREAKTALGRGAFLAKNPRMGHPGEEKASSDPGRLRAGAPTASTRAALQMALL